MLVAPLNLTATPFFFESYSELMTVKFLTQLALGEGEMEKSEGRWPNHLRREQELHSEIAQHRHDLNVERERARTSVVGFTNILFKCAPVCM